MAEKLAFSPFLSVLFGGIKHIHIVGLLCPLSDSGTSPSSHTEATPSIAVATSSNQTADEALQSEAVGGIWEGGL